jgi:hypothetical protein
MSVIIDLPASKQLISRLVNWKFGQALAHVGGQPHDVQDVINALATVFGDCGWFEGNMGIIVGAALEGIGLSVEAKDF